MQVNRTELFSITWKKINENLIGTAVSLQTNGFIKSLFGRMETVEQNI